MNSVAGSAISDIQLHQQLNERAHTLCSYISLKIPRSMRGAISPEDIFQEICISAFRSIAAFRGDRDQSFNTWIWGITDRRLVDTIRAYACNKRGKMQSFVRHQPKLMTSLTNLFSQIVAPGRTPSSQAAASEMAHEVQVAIARLPEMRRKAIWMRYIEGRDQLEIARTLGKTKPAVNSLLHSGKKQLAVLLCQHSNSCLR